MRFAEFARQHPYEVRFIEFMPLDADRTWTRDRVLPNAEVAATDRRRVPARGRRPRAPRHRRGAGAFADGQGEIGFISPVTEPFCGDCNRIRLTAEGELRTCLFSMTETDLRAPLRAGATRRRARGRSSATPSGARSSSTTSTTRASCSRRARCRGSADEATSTRRWSSSSTGLAPLGAERVPLADAAGRVVAARGARSAVDLPPFDRSAMDGYAVRAADTAPGVALRLVGDVAAGEVARGALEPGTAARISTGAAIPPGADAVLQSEDAEVDDGTRARRRAALAPGMHVRCRGEDVHAGDVLAPRRRPADARRASPRSPPPASARSPSTAARALHLIVTGSELLPLGAPPEPGKIHESNGLMVRAARRARGRRGRSTTA